jgi:hypothetical protein
MSAFFFWFLLKLLPLSPMVKLLGQFEFEFEFELLHTHE